MSSEIAIKVQNLSKCYQIYDNPRDRLKQFFFPRVQLFFGAPQKRYYREFWALRDVSFELKAGKTVGIIGRNGSGKSTLLQMICGTISPTGGDVCSCGRIAALLELGAGFNPEFTGRENVHMNASLLGLTSDQIKDRFSQIVDFSEIGDFIDQPVKTYSSGMFVRLAFSVIAHVNADVLVIDEALAVGDIRFQNKCQRKLEEIKASGCSILFVSHSPGTVEAFCDHVIWLEGGLLYRQGKPADLVRDYVNAMTHGFEFENIRENQKEIIDGRKVGHNDLVPNRSSWEWVRLETRHNIRNTSRAIIEAVRVRFDGVDSATVIDSAPCLLEVEAMINVCEGVPRPLAAIGVFNNLNEPIIHVNSFNLRQPLSAITRAGRVKLNSKINLPALKPGEYVVAIGLDEGEPGASEVLSHAYAAWAFLIRPPSESMAQGGYVQIQNAKVALTALGDIE